MPKSIEAKVKGIIVDQLDVDEKDVTSIASLRNDLGADSIDIMELVMTIEELYNISISDKECEKAETFGQLVDCVKEKTKG